MPQEELVEAGGGAGDVLLAPEASRACSTTGASTAWAWTVNRPPSSRAEGGMPVGISRLASGAVIVEAARCFMA